MTVLAPLLSLLVQVVPGVLLASCLVPASGPARLTRVAGYGLLLGLLGSALTLVVLDWAGVTLGPLVLSLGHALLVGLLLWPARWLKQRSAPVPAEPPFHWSAASAWLAAVCLGLLGLHAAFILTEVLLRPLYPWDATSAWATKARVWFEFRSLVDFIPREDWLQAADMQLFTDHRPEYPILTPLLQTWTTIFLGARDPRLMNIDWPLLWAALGLIFYGQARAVGARPPVALVFTYFLLSMPLVNTHAALAGYADLFMAAVFLAALLAFYRWAVDGETWQGAMAALLVLTCPLVKNEGLYWAAAFLPGLLYARLPVLTATAASAGAALLVLLALWLVPEDLVVAGHSLAALDLHYRPGAVLAMLKSLAWFENWHLLFYGLVALAFLSLLTRQFEAQVLPVTVILGGVAVLLVILFGFTGYAAGSIGFTAVSRISFPLATGLVFLALLLYLPVDRAVRNDTRGAATAV